MPAPPYKPLDDDFDPDDPQPVDPMLALSKAGSIGASPYDLASQQGKTTTMGMPMPSPSAMAWLGLGKADTPQSLKDVAWNTMKNAAGSKVVGQAVNYLFPPDSTVGRIINSFSSPSMQALDR